MNESHARYKNPALPLAERLEDLLGQMTLAWRPA